MFEAAKKVWAEPKTTETFGKEVMDRIMKDLAAR
jgi:hypothetical protein